MDEDRRAQMIGSVADGPPARGDAETFVDANTAAPLPPPLRERAVADVMRSARGAWRDWLERGSREDWSDAVPRLSTPALIVAGGEDGDLGEEAQRRLNAPLYADAHVEVIAGTAHLLPYERADRVAALIAAHWDRVRDRALPPPWARLLASDRVTRRTRAALLARVGDPPEDAPSCLDAAQRATLAALVGRILPGVGGTASLARRIDVALADGAGDGWRFAALPPDAAAWRQGLDTLDAIAGGFAALDEGVQEAVLRRLEDGVEDGGGPLDGERLRLWFEDARAETVRTWLSLPATMARIGYDGFANGGDGRRPQGFARTAADDREPWQPEPAR